MADDDSVTLSRRRVLGSLVATGLAATGAGAGTFAYFRDTESSTGNRVRAGTVDLTIVQGESGAFTLSNAKPGNEMGGDVYLRNAGTIDPDHAEIRFSATETERAGPKGTNGGDTAPNSADGMAELLKVTTLAYPEKSGGQDLLNEVSDHNGNGIIDLDDVVDHGVFDDLRPPSNGNMETLAVSLTFVDTEGLEYNGRRNDDDFQGDELAVTIEFAIAQRDGQSVL